MATYSDQMGQDLLELERTPWIEWTEDDAHHLLRLALDLYRQHRMLDAKVAALPRYRLIPAGGTHGGAELVRDAAATTVFFDVAELMSALTAYGSAT